MRTETATMVEPPKYDYTPNRHERRAQAAIERNKLKKMKKQGVDIKKLFKDLNIDPKNVESWNQEKVEEFKEAV